MVLANVVTKVVEVHWCVDTMHGLDVLGFKIYHYLSHN